VKIAWRTYDDMVAACRANLDRVRALDPDVIVGIPRAGMVPATILASMLGLPLSDLWSFCDGRALRAGDVRAKHRARCEAKRALLVDDASGFGRSMTAACEEAAEKRPDVKVLPCTVYADPEAVSQFALAMEPLAKPRLFEWMWWRSGKLAHCCVDIDGVVCADPTSEQKRDPASYRQFIASTPLLCRPAKTVGAFVTGRSGAYRKETEAYFKRHGIAYRALVMRDGDRLTKTIEAHAEHKAEHYRKSDAVLFIESDARQAEMIAQMTRKDALCVTTGRMYRGRNRS
jgi:hypothetical protein